MLVTDLDDTLYKEFDYVRSGFRVIGELLEHNGIIAASEALRILTSATDIRSGFDTLSNIIKATQASSRFDDKWMVDIYRTHKPQIQLSENIADLFLRLTCEGIKIAIITDGRSHTQRAKIEALGLDRFVLPQNIIISSEAGGEKTTRIPFDTLISRNPGETHYLYLGDNPAKDFLWPNLMGWTTVQLNDIAGVNIHSQTIDVPEIYKAQYRIDKIEDIVRYLQSQ